jgi:predicted DNA-binding transcriptional regulator AlpA
MKTLSIQQCAEFLQISKGRLYNMRSKNEGPPSLKGKTNLYALSDIERWLRIGV